jgi:methyl-accepting chemotaxis protein-1 (serine sensor receptor)
MKISTKLTWFFVCIMIIFVGLAWALLSDIKAVSVSYDALLAGPVRQAEAARVIQVEFKKQVQEWKDILLRGHNPDDLTKYTNLFHEREAKVKAEARELAAQVEDPQIRQTLQDFLRTDDELSVQYQAAYDVFVGGHFDYKAADKLVRGRDREPTDLFDKVVAALNDRVAAQVASHQADAVRQRNQALLLAGVLLAGVGLAGLIVVQSIVSRLGRLKAVSDRLAVADVTGLDIDISGEDEIGVFGESLKGVAAAIEELSSMSAPKAA